MIKFVIEKDFVVNGYRCVITGNILGHRCGYIEIPKNHPLYGKYYSIIDEVIDIHGGYISVESEIGKGSVFRIIMPNRYYNIDNYKVYDIDNYNTELELSDIYEISI